MRTTITLDAEAEKAIAALRRESGMGPSAAVNELIHRGAAGQPRADYTFPSHTFNLGARMPIDNIGEVLELLDEDDR